MIVSHLWIWRRECLTREAAVWFSQVVGSDSLFTKSLREIVFALFGLASSDCVFATRLKNNMHIERTLLWACVSTHASALSLPTLQRMRRAALNRQWLIYSMIVYFAWLSVMDEDLCTFEKSVWNMVTSGRRGLFKNQLPQGELAAGLWDNLSSYHHLV